jgi:abhydrolase domain-containing protein 13
MRRLYNVCRANVKIWKEFPRGQHNDTVAEEHYFEYIADFVVNQVMHNR